MPLLDNSRHLWRTWKAIWRISIIREMEFRANFFLGLTRQFIWLGIFILVVKTIFQNTASLGGWGESEVFIIVAISRFIEGFMNMTFAYNLSELPNAIQQGTFDFYVVKPLPTQFQAAFRRVSIDQLGNFVGGIFLFIYGVLHLHTTIAVSQIFIFALLLALGITAFYSLLIITISLAFFLERFESFYAFMGIFTEPFTVPFTVFPRVPRFAMTYLLPLAFVVFIPAQALTGRLALWEIPVAILITTIFLTLANMAWRAGLKRYSSASS